MAIKFADDLGRLEYTRNLLGGRNPFHPDRPGVGVAALHQVSNTPQHWSFPQGEPVTLPQGLTLTDWQHALPSLAQELEADRRSVKDSPTLCISGPGADGVVVDVQHCRSGLRAQFYVRASDGFIQVLSRPYSEPNTCRLNHPTLFDNRGPEWWWRYCGLGIGKLVYAEAWKAIGRGRVAVYANPTPEALYLRQHLHRAAPYSWESRLCDLEPCRSDGWRTAQPADMH